MAYTTGRILLTRVLVRASLENGYRFLDIAGGLLASLHGQFPRLSLDSEGVHAGAPGSKVEEVHVSASEIRLAISEPDSIQFVVDQASSRISELVTAINPTRIDAMELESNWVLPIADDFDAGAWWRKVALTQKLQVAVPSFDSFEAKFVFTGKDVSHQLSVAPATRSQAAPRTLPTNVLLVEVASQSIPANLKEKTLRPWLASALQHEAELLNGLQESVLSNIPQPRPDK